MSPPTEDEAKAWVEKNQETPLLVESFQINGLSRTKGDIIRKIFYKTTIADSVGSLCAHSSTALQRVAELGIFKDTNLILLEGSQPNSASIVLNVAEKKNRSVSIKQEFGGSGSNMVFDATLGNAFGRAEDISANFKWGSRSRFSFGGLFRKPIIGENTTYFFEAETYREARDCTDHSLYKESNHGASARFKIPSLGGTSIFSYDVLWREISNLPLETPLSVREHSGHSLKSSIRHIFVKDSINQPVFPQTGYRLRIQNEFAGLGGNVTFFKHEVAATKYIQLKDRFVLSIGLECGMLHSTQDALLPISDRFFIGGASSLKGFQEKSLGARDKGACLGGSLYGVTNAKIFFPLSSEESSGNAARGIIFFNSGSSILRESGASWSRTLNQFDEEIRTAAGFGISFGIPMGYIDITYSVPIHFKEGDKIHKVQFGFTA